MNMQKFHGTYIHVVIYGLLKLCALLIFFTFLKILIRGPNAHLIIGSEESPFTHRAVITLTGKRNDQPLSLSNTAQLGSKALGIFGNV